MLVEEAERMPTWFGLLTQVCMPRCRPQWSRNIHFDPRE